LWRQIEPGIAVCRQGKCQERRQQRDRFLYGQSILAQRPLKRLAFRLGRLLLSPLQGTVQEVDDGV
jgi:hypothetical protein